MSDSRPIGLFDSGLGGLTVSREIFNLMPDESIVYFGDTLHAPYGSRRTQELINFADQIIAFLVSCNVKYIVFACNTNSSLSLRVMRKRYSVPMKGLIEPGAKLAVSSTVNKRVGIIATEATVNSRAYQRAINSLNPSVSVFAQAAPLLVPLVEAGMPETREAFEAVCEYTEPLKSADIDTLILGCTHYPFLYEHFRKCLGPEIIFVDPAAATVLESKEDMDSLNMLKRSSKGNPSHRYFVSGDPSDFAFKAEKLGCGRINAERAVLDKS
ncbi:MAG TPA: glutamate racemase [Desulfotomaculum sp.]|nr:MAG: Glutamate racemase [Desulfotomaculum sp. 46_80]HAG11022.1 glutamate racemase [Desulfotomaculum sp.]HBY04897.1 glutamate racemase [Desulfotomaculum sp.]